MAKRRTSGGKQVQMGFRVSESLKEQIDAAADEAEMSSNSWLLMAAREKLARDATTNHEYLEEMIRDIIAKIEEERKKEKMLKNELFRLE